MLITSAPPTIGSAVRIIMPRVSFCRLAVIELSKYSLGIPSPPILYFRIRKILEQRLASEIPQILPATENARIVFCASLMSRSSNQRKLPVSL